MYAWSEHLAAYFVSFFMLLAADVISQKTNAQFKKLVKCLLSRKSQFSHV